MLDQLDSTRAVVLVDSPYTATVSFYSAGAIADPGTVTYAVTNDAGTAVTSGTASGTGAAARTFSLTASHTTDLDVLTVVWTSSTLGSITTQVEVVGGFVCAVGQIDQILSRGGTSSDYTVLQKEQARTVATDAFEQACGVAFTPRYRREKLRGTDDYVLGLPTPRVLSVRAVSIDGTALTADELADIDVDLLAGEISREAGWSKGSWGQRNITVTWEHGYEVPPADVSRAVALIASAILADGPWDDRGYGVTEGGGVVRLLTAGVSGAAFSIPEVQAALARYRFPRVA